jgi:hypothetical protein
LTKARSVGSKTAFLTRFGKAIDHRQAQCGDAVHNEVQMSEEEQ